ncbi:zincin-like metallopeptidase domain-containing protein [Fusobacterium sp.]|uniref:zincin-like metallopeptidase domain-containing protein n=1 Tax=Fusobacterium sp. TaxID=68766 RepID=UPI0028FFB984|nr:zincin-like metallopeptidase domain-containing protein [Fusobacterium sp.]MDU1912596.1 zincin-like metallopeptidase domain-containing protein [Fusobacterium sp.]
MIAASMCPIKEVGQEQAYYSPSKDEIVLPLRESFKDSESFLSTALHEMIHSTGHESRLNRDKGHMFGSPEYAKEELIAELGSVFLQGDLGIKLEGEHFQDHSNYLKSWIGALKEDYHELFRACIEAEKIGE